MDRNRQCSRTRGDTRRGCLRTPSLLAAIGLLPALSPCATGMNWPDIESRIQYAYYTQDVRTLRRVLDVLTGAEGHDALQSYYTGLANYRLTLLAAHQDRSRAKQSAEQCVSSLDLTLKAQRDSPDALALQAACLDLLAGLEAWRAPLAASRSGSQSERAKQLAPHNPRVLLLAAAADYERSKAATAERDRALADLKGAAAAFEAERQDTEHTPGWGAAEVYVYLARGYLDRGAALEARDALERALLIAPEYTEARQLMSKLTSMNITGPRGAVLPVEA